MQMMVRPIPNAGHSAADGTLNVSLASGEVIGLPPYLRVDHFATQAGRDHFRVLEGLHKGKTASVTNEGGSHLMPAPALAAKRLLHFLPGKKLLKLSEFTGQPTIGAFVKAGKHLRARPSPTDDPRPRSRRKCTPPLGRGLSKTVVRHRHSWAQLSSSRDSVRRMFDSYRTYEMDRSV
jgi:hypothetical protein